MNPILKTIIDRQKRDFERRSAERSVPEELLDGIREERNIPYAEDGNPAHVMDLYYPNTVQIPTPVIINIHGGGLTTGSKDFNRPFCINLCKMGFIVFSIEYRLCPEVTVFHQLEDIYTAMKCIDGIMPRVKAEPGHCLMVGDEAGAMLALYAAAIQRNPELARAAGIHPSYLEIKSLALLSGMFYTTKLDKLGLVIPRAFYGEQYRKHPFYPYLNPNNEAVSMFLPPCFLTTSRHDRFHRYSYSLTTSIRQCGGDCILFDFGRDPSLTCGFAVSDPELPASREVIEDIAFFFNDNP